MTCSAAYRHAPLNPSKAHDMRLARSLPSQADSEIALTLANVSLDEVKVTYDAISYMWGSQQPLHQVIVDGQSLALRGNIYAFLRHCTRSDLQVTHLWIDSVCIDQDNTSDKNAQVGLMGKIFGKAKRVFIWLGEPSETGYLAQWHACTTGAEPSASQRSPANVWWSLPGTNSLPSHRHCDTTSTSHCTIAIGNACGLSRKSYWRNMHTLCLDHG